MTGCSLSSQSSALSPPSDVKPFHIVAIGGGGGATQVLKAAQPFADQLTAVIAVTDTGRSTGLARAIGGIPAPGDLRATIAAFATDPLLAGCCSSASAAQACRSSKAWPSATC